MLPFPTEAPYRIDQVTAAPMLLAVLVLAQVMAAALMSWAACKGRSRLWWGAAGLLLTLVALFFTLASWGTSDITKLSFYFTHDLSRVRGEPFWIALAPLIVHLPYRMAAVHGLVAASFAAAPLLLSKVWRHPGWGGWWALLVCCSPLLRNFLQNGVTRQALATLLLLPVLLWAGRLAPVGRRGLAVGVVGSAMVHTTFLATLLLSLSPLLVSGAGSWRGRLARLRSSLGAAPGRLSWPRLLVVLALLVLLGLLIAVAAPTIRHKLEAYLTLDLYFNHYPVARAVRRLQQSMGLGVVLGCWQRRLGWRALLACGHSRQLALFAGLYLLIQATVEWEWFPQITTRFADPVGFALLIVFLAWIQHHRTLWVVLPALLVTGHEWLFDRILASGDLACGRNDAFLCVPDRWPWQIRY